MSGECFFCGGRAPFSVVFAVRMMGRQIGSLLTKGSLFPWGISCTDCIASKGL
jgi:hypothetical protein